MDAAKVLIVEDEVFFREMLQRTLAIEADI